MIEEDKLKPVDLERTRKLISISIVVGVILILVIKVIWAQINTAN